MGGHVLHRTLDKTRAKGWFIGPWNSVVDIPIGFANQAVDEPHSHAQMYEVYLVARGESTALVAGKTITLRSGDMLVVEPGEVHTFTAYTPDYLHFVIQTPFVKDDKILREHARG
jgi:quercetin dioxygenase-like cupin family protein